MRIPQPGAPVVRGSARKSTAASPQGPCSTPGHKLQSASISTGGGARRQPRAGWPRPSPTSLGLLKAQCISWPAFKPQPSAKSRLSFFAPGFLFFSPAQRERPLYTYQVDRRSKTKPRPSYGRAFCLFGVRVLKSPACKTPPLASGSGIRLGQPVQKNREERPVLLAHSCPRRGQPPVLPAFSNCANKCSWNKHSLIPTRPQEARCGAQRCRPVCFPT